MQHAVNNRATIRVADRTDLSGRVTAGSIKRGLFAKKQTSLWGSPIFGCAVLVSVLALGNTANASEVTAPFYSVAFGNANPMPTGPCTLTNHETFTGFALPTGAFSGTEDETIEFLSCSPPSPPGPSIVVSGKFTWIMANGDEIDGELQTTGTLDPVNGAIFQGSFRFLSGTGQFKHVKGSGILQGHGTATATSQFVAAFIGTITYGGTDDD
jgi:hypothetical protein